MFQLHEEAKLSFNRTAEALVGELKEVQEEGSTATGRPPGLHADHVLSEKDIDDVPWCREVEGLTQRLLGVRIFDEGRIFRIDADTGFESFCAQISSRRELRRHISATSVENRLLVWFREALRNGPNDRFIESLLDWLQASVQEREVWVPVANLHLESDLVFGDVVFRSVTKEIIDDWADALPSTVTDEDRAHWERRIRKAQGHAAAICQLRTDHTSVLDVAALMAEEAVTLLRLAGGRALEPRAQDCMHLRGRVHPSSHEAWIVEPGQPPAMVAHMLVPFPEPFWLSDEAVSILSKQLDPLSELFVANPRSSFQDVLARALTFYSKSALTRDPGEKLLSTMTALEILLLGDQDAIQQRIAERMAFIVSDEVEERLAIVQLVRRCYGMRSKYVHHGRSPEALEDLRTFMRYTFRFLLQALWAHRDFATKDEMLAYIERIKYSGSESLLKKS